MKTRYLRELDSLVAAGRRGHDLSHAVVQGLDLRDLDLDWNEVRCEGTVFLGCHFPEEVRIAALVERGATVFPGFPGLPYDPYRPVLYTREELMEGWTAEEDHSTDRRIYDHFVANGKGDCDVLEALAQRLHDHAMDDALEDLLAGSPGEDQRRKVVGIMGGHGRSRASEEYRKAARLARVLARDGYFVASGGGPGIMEAANLGAYLADGSETDLDGALETLARAPVYTSPGYLEAAQEVVARCSQGRPSLAIPTWFYGHEPSNLFSIHIAKYFSNGLREDRLLTIAQHGIVFAPGSAGTTQEVFQDATQNHYATFGVVSPMVFLGREHFGDRMGIFDCLRRQAEGRPYAEALCLTDEVSEAADFIRSHPPREVEP